MRNFCFRILSPRHAAGAVIVLAIGCAAPAFSPEAPQAAAPVASGHTEATSEKRSGAVVITNVDTNFIQHGASCTLSSYGIVASYFTREPVSAFFEGYCHRFGIFYVTPLQAEERYAKHFDDEWKLRQCRGIEVILDLHSNSFEKCFVEARRNFDARFYLDASAHIEEIEKTLKSHEALCNIGYKMGDDVHTVTVFYNGKRLLVRDTVWKGFYSINGLKELGELVDGVLYTRR